MHDQIIAVPRLLVKRPAANPIFRQSNAMAGRPRQEKPREPSCELHALFLRRVKEEIARLEISSDRQLENRNESGLPQRTISETLRKQADPKTLNISRFAKSLGVQPWELLVERDEAERMKISTLKPIPAVTKYLSPGQRLHGKTGQVSKVTKRVKE